MQRRVFFCRIAAHLHRRNTLPKEADLSALSIISAKTRSEILANFPLFSNIVSGFETRRLKRFSSEILWYHRTRGDTHE